MNATERVQQFIGQLVVTNATLQEQVDRLQQELQKLTEKDNASVSRAQPNP